MKSTVSVVLALLLAACFCFSAFAAAGNNVELRRIEMNATAEVRAGQTKVLAFLLVPTNATDAALEWSTSDRNVVVVEDHGLIRGVNPGTAVVKVESEGGKTAACTVTVTGSSALPATAASSASLPTGEFLGASELRRDIEDALVHTGSGNTAILNYTDKTGVSAAILRLAHTIAEYENCSVLMRFNTTDSNSKTQGRIQINIDDTKNHRIDIKTGVYTSIDKTKKQREKLQSQYKNDFELVKLEHSGSYGMYVNITARLDLKGLDTDNLMFYVYSPSGNHKLIDIKDYSVSDTGYLHFTTYVGGTMIVTDSALV